MVISFRGNVIALGKAAVRVADSLLTVCAARSALIKMVYSEEDADTYIETGVKMLLEAEKNE